MKPLFFVFSLIFLCALPSLAIVSYDEGAVTINGIQLFRDLHEEKHYYYIPPYPRLSSNQEGDLEMMCIKYIGKGGEESNGGLFHALIEFTLDEEDIQELEKELRKKVPGAIVMGVVPMQEAMSDGQDGVASFKVISSILTSTGSKNSFTKRVITSGHAPFFPGSKAAIAAQLNQAGATLLWESFQGGTSDVSVAVEGYFRASIKGYNAVVTADLNIVYEHFSTLSNQQGQENPYKKSEIRNVLDSLVQTQAIKIEVFDQSQAAGIKTDDMQKILDLVTTKVMDLIFDTETGWAKLPKQEVPANAQLKGRHKRGDFTRFFFGAGNQAYVKDDLFVLKQRKDIRSFNLALNLTKRSSIKVPVYTSGNLKGLFNEYNEQGKYFRVVDLDDPDFQQREIFFQIDGDFVDAFGDLLNFATVSFRKDQGDKVMTRDILFKRSELAKGKDIQSVTYPRLGRTDASWLEYEYKVGWSIKGRDSVFSSTAAGVWEEGQLPSITLIPPFQKRVVEIDLDRAYLKEMGYRSAQIRFFSILGGEAVLHKSVIIRQEDASNTQEISLYHDPGKPLAYIVQWYSKEGEKSGELTQLDGSYLFLVPPQN